MRKRGKAGVDIVTKKGGSIFLSYFRPVFLATSWYASQFILRFVYVSSSFIFQLLRSAIEFQRESCYEGGSPRASSMSRFTLPPQKKPSNINHHEIDIAPASVRSRRVFVQISHLTGIAGLSDVISEAKGIHFFDAQINSLFSNVTPMIFLFMSDFLFHFLNSINRIYSLFARIKV